MKLRLSLILFLVLVAAFKVEATAQVSKSNSSAAQGAEDLRAQLLDVQAKESELQARARQLDEDLKPENIERFFAGVGSTRPEELREMRRRQLTIERERVQAQLKLFATSRERLESVIRVAETQAYHESADESAAPLQMLKFATGSRAVGAMFAGVAAMVGVVFVIAGVIRRRKTV